MIIYMILAMSTTLLIRHLVGRRVAVIDGRRPLAALPRYIGTLHYTGKNPNLYYVDGSQVRFNFRLAQVVSVDGNVITLGNPQKELITQSSGLRSSMV
jgi:hypothetical protein